MTKTFKDGIIEHLPALRAYARSLLRDREAADDLVEKTLAVAVTKQPQPPPEADLKIWLFKILHDIYVDDQSGKTGDPKSDTYSRSETELSPRPQEDNGDQTQGMQAAFHALPDAYKEALALVTIHGLSDQEAAKVADVSVRMQRTRTDQARKMLKDRPGLGANGKLQERQASRQSPS